MAMEHASTRVVPKPWGRTDLQPWSEHPCADGAVGEIWFQRTDERAAPSHLLLKLLFTAQPLSIQVHPTDAFARASGMPSGKNEAWYILDAAPDAKIAVGLKRPLSGTELRAAIEDRSIADLVQWYGVVRGDFINVPAGTIHAIGEGLVVAEVQQRSDVTFRLFDHGRTRELHVNEAVVAAFAGPAVPGAPPSRLTETRSLMLASPHFVVERIELPPGSSWQMNAEKETWMLMLEGDARIGLVNTFLGEAVFMEAVHTSVDVGSDGMVGLVAYLGPEPATDLLHRLDGMVGAPPLGDAEMLEEHA